MFGSNSDKPSAAEQMVAKLLGFTPEQMQETIVGFRNTILAVAEQMKRVEDTQVAILAIVKELQNERSERNDNGSGGDAGRLPGNGDVGQRDGATGGDAGIGA